MSDHTMSGVPVARVSTSDLLEILRDGFVINRGDESPQNRAAVIERIRIELLIRELGLR